MVWSDFCSCASRAKIGALANLHHTHILSPSHSIVLLSSIYIIFLSNVLNRPSQIESSFSDHFRMMFVVISVYTYSNTFITDQFNLFSC